MAYQTQMSNEQAKRATSALEKMLKDQLKFQLPGKHKARIIHALQLGTIETLSYSNSSLTAIIVNPQGQHMRGRHILLYRYADVLGLSTHANGLIAKSIIDNKEY
jgi:hypothetical protein